MTDILKSSEFGRKKVLIYSLVLYKGIINEIHLTTDLLQTGVAEMAKSI